ncbi:OSTM1 [Bugula neritina]|uniref:OSTM1 n=1 Tax=Bugula neritina TaxID=10212 RepID=A0A7J7IX95_BUGNE|nr:OSTM1 [Bugula neritina]
MQSLSGELGVMLSPEIHSVELKAAHRKNKSSGDITSICNAFASRFADAAANYTRCFIENSRPLQLCMNCVKEYLIVNRAYSDLEQMTDHPMSQGREKTDNCKDWILNADMVMAIQQTKSFFKHLWSTSHCDRCVYVDCFASMSWTGNITWTPAKFVIHFRELANTTITCFANYTAILKYELLPGVRTEENNKVTANQSVACQVCNTSYLNLNADYKDLDTKYGSDLCMDIVDAMNYTRIIWANTFNCTRNTPQDGITITITVLFLLLPAVFYIGSHIHYQRLEKKIVKQNRMMRSRHASILTPENTDPFPVSPSSAPPTVQSNSDVTS